MVEHASYLKRTDNQIVETPITAHTANRFSHPSSTHSKNGNFRAHQYKPSGAYYPSHRRQAHSTLPTTYRGRCQLCSTQSHSAQFCHLLRQQWTYTPNQQ